MTFSATDAAFEGFRLTRRKPLTILVWGLAYVAFMALAFALVGGALVSLMAEMERLQQVAEPTLEELQALVPLYGAMGALVPLGLVFGAVLNAAVARGVVRPQESAFGYLRLGMDEVRVLGVSFILGLVFFAVSLVGFGLVGVAAGMAGATQQGFMWLVAVLLGLAVTAGIIWLAVRLSLAVPIVVAERRFALFDSFALTRGRVWPLIGMSIIAFVLAAIVGLLGSVVFLPITLMTGNLEQLAAYEGAGVPEIVAAMGPAIAAYIVVNAILSALQLAVMYAPFAAAYRDIKAG